MFNATGKTKEKLLKPAKNRILIYNGLFITMETNKKSWSGNVALVYSIIQVGHCIMDCIKLKFNDIITIPSGDGLSVWIFDIVISYYIIEVELILL